MLGDGVIRAEYRGSFTTALRFTASVRAARAVKARSKIDTCARPLRPGLVSHVPSGWDQSTALVPG